MVKFTIRSTYSEVSLYARWTACSPAGKPDGAKAHGYPRLADADDVAARAAEDWDREFSVRKGSRRDFADGIRAKLDRWAGGSGDTRHARAEHRAFRSEVAVSIGVRLEIWAAAENPDGAAA